jgi:UDP-glucose 4-epimerase
MSWRGKRVLVTGGAGFVGSSLVLRLVAEGAEVRVIDCLLEGGGGNPYNLSSVVDRVRWSRSDLADAPDLHDLSRDLDCVFHLAGQGNHQDSMARPEFDLRCNLTASIRLLEALRAAGSRARVVYTSTRQVYGAPKYVPVDESHPIAPPDVNGVHKYAVEQLLSVYGRAYALDSVSLRLTNTFGPRQLIRHARQGFIGWFVNRALAGETIQLFGGGNQKRDFTHVDDVVEALLLAATSDRVSGASFNLAGEVASLGDIARAIVDAAGSGRVEKIPFPEERRKIDIGDYYGVSKKFEGATGWKPRMALADGIRGMVSYYQTHGSHYLDQEATAP